MCKLERFSSSLPKKMFQEVLEKGRIVTIHLSPHHIKKCVDYW
jgi:hypothetical protein